MTEPRIRPERFTTQPGEVELVKFAAGRWRPRRAPPSALRGQCFAGAQFGVGPGNPCSALLAPVGGASP